jgi:hypothetical protein
VLDAEYFRHLTLIPERYAGKPAVEGAVLPPPQAKPPFTHSLFNPSGGTYATANMAFHVATVLALGGFDEEFPANLREDTDLALTLLERHGAIPFWSEWKVYHPHIPRRLVPSLVQAWTRHDRMLRAEYRLHRKHPETYGKVRHHPDAAATVRNWRWRWSLLYLRECAAFLRSGTADTPSKRARALGLSAAAALVAGWEQICIAWWCLTQGRNSGRADSA